MKEKSLIVENVLDEGEVLACCDFFDEEKLLLVQNLLDEVKILACWKVMLLWKNDSSKSFENEVV